MTILSSIEQRAGIGQKMFSVLIDPDKVDHDRISLLIDNSIRAKVDYFLVGGSLISESCFQDTLTLLCAQDEIPVIIFPGNYLQISRQAKALLLLSMVSGRNPELLIGQHVLAAPSLRESGIETISTAYMLIDGGKSTSVSYMSNTQSIPRDKPAIAVATAMAAEMIGMKLIYLEAGSGAAMAVDSVMVRAVKNAVKVPVITGGGIRTTEQAHQIAKAGADMLVVGTAFEKDPMLLMEMVEAAKG